MMTMKSKQFHFESHDGKFYTALFSLTKVEDKEVYEFLAKEEEQKDFLHYGYITKAMAEKLLSKRERDGRMYIQSVSLKSNPKDIPQKQKIILDLPDEIDEKSFLPGGLPFQAASLTLYSKSYQEKLVPAVTIKPHSSFTFDTNESTVIFKFPNNEMECTTFMVNEFKEGTHNTIDLNVENSKAEDIIIQGVRPISSINNETYLWIKNKEREVIYVYGVLLPSNVEKKEALFNEGVSYIPISANGAIRIYHAKIEADLNTITRCGIYSGGGIEVQDGDLAFGRGTSILQVGEGLSVENMKLVISGDNNIERSLGIKTDNSCISHSMIRNTTITNSTFFNNAKLIVGVRDRQGSEHSTSINNLTLKKNTTLILQSFMNGNNKRVLNNSIVEEGEILVTNKNGYEINNSLLNNGKIELNNEENMVISNSNIKGKIYLQNISGIDCAILENSTIVASKSMPIEDAEIKEKNIQDYYLYQKSFRNHIEQEQKDIGKADAQNWEVL